MIEYLIGQKVDFELSMSERLFKYRWIWRDPYTGKILHRSHRVNNKEPYESQVKIVHPDKMVPFFGEVIEKYATSQMQLLNKLFNK